MKIRQNSHSKEELSALRYCRQSRAFPPDLRRGTMLYLFGGQSNFLFARALLSGAAAMGIRRVGADFPGQSQESAHWFRAGFPAVVNTINSEVEYRYLDPDFPATDLEDMESPNAWVVVAANTPIAAYVTLDALADSARQTRVLVSLCGSGGILVVRFPHLRAAADSVARFAREGPAEIAPGGAALAVLAAGVVLNEVMLGPTQPGDDLSQPRVIGFYDLHQPRRVAVPDVARFEDLTMQVAATPDRPAVLPANRHSAMIGAGAIGTWVGLIESLEGGVHLDVYDGDTIERHNLNRQILFVNARTGEQKASVLTRELGLIDPQSTFKAFDRFVTTERDLEDSSGFDLLMAVPDNDAARLLCGDLAREKKVLFGTAGSGPSGGQVVLSRPDGPCYRCLGGTRDPDAAASSGSQSCSQVENDAVICSNMVVAGLLVSEIRVAQAGVPAVNIRFLGDSTHGNRFARMITNVPCPHRD